MNEQDFPLRVTQGQDGVYRWRYDMDMYGNHYLRNVLLKVTGAICLGMYVFLLLLLSGSGDFSPRTVLLALLPFLGAVLLALLGYYIAAAVMHGVYHLRFEMDDASIRLVRKPSTQRMMDALADVAVLAGTRVGPSLNAAAGSGCTRFSHVRGFRERPQYDAINLREWTGANQIWIPAEDYALVRDFMLARVPEKVRQRSSRA